MLTNQALVKCKEENHYCCSVENDKVLLDIMEEMDKCRWVRDERGWGCSYCPVFIGCQVVVNILIDRSTKRKLLNGDRMWFDRRWVILQRALENAKGRNNGHH